jgi:hypothetical protein
MCCSWSSPRRNPPFLESYWLETILYMRQSGLLGNQVQFVVSGGNFDQFEIQDHYPHGLGFYLMSHSGVRFGDCLRRQGPYPYRPLLYALYRLHFAHLSCLGVLIPGRTAVESVNSWREGFKGARTGSKGL